MYRKQYIKEVESIVDLAKCNECLTDLEFLNGTLGHITHDIATHNMRTIQAALYHVFYELQKTRRNLEQALKEKNNHPFIQLREAAKKTALCFPSVIPKGQERVSFNIPAYVIEELNQALGD